MRKLEPLFKVTNPEYLWLAKKPIRLGGNAEKTDISEIEQIFKIQFTENIMAEENLLEFQKQQFEYDATDKINWEKVSKRFDNPIHEKLIICYINEEVGYGLFAKDEIKAGDVISLYAGKLQKRVSRLTTDYGMVLDTGKNKGFSVVAEKMGGIARFVQHMPFSVEKILDFIFKSTDLDLLLKRLDANGILFSQESIENIKREHSLETYIEQEKKKFSQYLRSIAEKNNLSKVNFGGKRKKQLAYANLKSFSFVYNNKPIIFFQACVDISPGDQLGISYGNDYWSLRNIHPKYFNLDGTIIPTINRQEKVTYQDNAFSFLKGIYNPKNNLSDDDDIKHLLKKYKLGPYTQLNLECGLRKAAAIESPKDLKIFIKHVDNIDAQGPKSKKTALHFAFKHASQQCKQILLSHGAKSDILDVDNKSATDYEGFYADSRNFGMDQKLKF